MLWLALAGLFAAATVLLVPLPFDSRLGAVVGDLAHAPFFAGITLCALLLWQRFDPIREINRRWLVRLALASLLVIAFGILIEFLQAGTGRKPAIHDAVANAFGVFVAGIITIAILIRHYHPSYRRWCIPLGLFAVATFLFAWWQPLYIISDIVAARQSFPLLSSFEREVELTRWYFDDSRAELTTEYVTDGQQAMRWHLDPAEHPAATLIEVVPDWINVVDVSVDVTLAATNSEPLELIFKVIDRHHRDFHDDTARKIVWLKPGQTRRVTMNRDAILQGPNDRELDLRQIKFVSLLVLNPPPGTFVDVDRLQLKITE